jgi:hypothetical protein
MLQLLICITTISVIVTGHNVTMVSLAALRPTIASPSERITFGFPLNRSRSSVSSSAVGESTRLTIFRVQKIGVRELCLRTAS